MFNKWRKVLESYNFKEYLTPVLEDASLYRAKSGEDIGGKELFIVKRPNGKEFALRPEMTPSVTRMVTKFYNASTKPIKLFSIANYFRGERPQRGRNREFWQLNFDIFGSNKITSDIEILQIAIDTLLSFNPPKGSFTLNINNRKLIDYFLKDLDNSSKIECVRLLDKFKKLTTEDFNNKLVNIVNNSASVSKITDFISSISLEELISKYPDIENNEGYLELVEITRFLRSLGYSSLLKFDPTVIRGFDYYDGMIFEIFDTNPDNNKSLFGGGRYNGLADLFQKNNFPAVGCGAGELTLKNFLEVNNLIPEDLINKDIYYAPILEEGLADEVYLIAKNIRINSKIVETSTDKVSFKKALDYCNKNSINNLIILGENEKKEGIYKIKNLETGEEKSFSL